MNKYLNFDIEASNGTNICSFGYVIYDNDLKLIEKKDIVINPEAPFYSYIWEKEKSGMVLAYSEKTFTLMPNFKGRYDLISKIISDSYIVIGFAHENDVRFLKIACDRYNLKRFSYVYIDIQRYFVKKYGDKTKAKSLETIAEFLKIDDRNFILHKSDDDAALSMVVFKKLLQLDGYKNIDEFIKNNKEFLHFVIDCEVFSMDSTLENEINKRVYGDLTKEVKRYANSKNLEKAKKHFYFDINVNTHNYIQSLKTIDYLFKNGYKYTSLKYANLVITDMPFSKYKDYNIDMSHKELVLFDDYIKMNNINGNIDDEDTERKALSAEIQNKLKATKSLFSLFLKSKEDFLNSLE